jgi:L-rhamnose mutarotase
MQRACFLARVRPGRLAEYRAAHGQVWPEMTAALREAGWANYGDEL